MLAIALVATVVLALVVPAVWWWFQRSNIKFPPGPKGHRLVGNGYQILRRRESLHNLLTSWASQHGGIYSLRIFTTRLLLLSGDEPIRRVMFNSGNRFNNRDAPVKGSMCSFTEGITYGQYSKEWVTMKRESISALESLEMGYIRRIEKCAHNVIHELLAGFDNQNTKPYSPEDDMKHAITDFMSWMIYGEGIKRSEVKEINENDGLVSDTTVTGPSLTSLNTFPYLPINAGHAIAKAPRIFDKLFGTRFARGKVRQGSADIICVLDALFLHQPQSQLSDCSIDHITRDFFLGGSGTTLACLSFFLIACANRPEIQTCAQQAIDDVIGRRLPTLADRRQLAYVEAMILETLRYLSPTPVVARRTVGETNFCGYLLPNDTLVWVNIWGLHHNDIYWKEPFSFQPTRFIGHDGAILPPQHPLWKRFLPFGAGSRQCAGQTLATDLLFLVTAAILQRFTILPESDGDLPAMDPRLYRFRFPLTPDHVRVRLLPRHTGNGTVHKTQRLPNGLKNEQLKFRI